MENVVSRRYRQPDSCHHYYSIVNLNVVLQLYILLLQRGRESNQWYFSVDLKDQVKHVCYWNLSMELTLNFIFEFYFLYCSICLRTFPGKVSQSRVIWVENLGFAPWKILALQALVTQACGIKLAICHVHICLLQYLCLHWTDEAHIDRTSNFVVRSSSRIDFKSGQLHGKRTNLAKLFFATLCQKLCCGFLKLCLLSIFYCLFSRKRLILQTWNVCGVSWIRNKKNGSTFL